MLIRLLTMFLVLSRVLVALRKIGKFLTLSSRAIFEISWNNVLVKYVSIVPVLSMCSKNFGHYYENVMKIILSETYHFPRIIRAVYIHCVNVPLRRPRLHRGAP